MMPADYGSDVMTGDRRDHGTQEYKDYDRAVRYWLEAAYEEAVWEHGRNEEIQQITRYIDYIVGKQWPTRRPTYRASPVDNRIWRLMWELVSLLTDIRPVFEVKATRAIYAQQANIVNQATRAWWMESDADLSLALIIIYAILSTGYGKVWWDQELRGGQGDFRLTPLGPSDLLSLKARNSLESAQGVIYRTLMPVAWFRQKFPEHGWKVQAEPLYSRFGPNEPRRPPHIPSMLYDHLSPAMQRTVGQPPQYTRSVYPMALYREFWLKDWTRNESNRTVLMGEPGTNWCYQVKAGQPLYPRGRLLIMGGREPVYDGPNPYWHASYPFEALRLNVVPWQFLGLSELRPLMPLQDIINNVLAGVLDMVKKAVNPPFYGPKNAFSESMWESLDWGMPGARAGYNPNVPSAPQFGPTPTLPAFVINVLQMAAREMDQSSGVAAVSEAVRKKQVPSGQTLEQVKEIQQTPIRLKGRNIEIFLRSLGRKNIFNIFQFYDAERRMYMLGKDGLTFEDLDWDPGTCVPAGMRPEDFARHFVFLIHPGSLLNVNQVQRAIQAVRLRMMNDISRKGLYGELGLALDVEQEERNLEEEQKRKIGMAMSAEMLASMMGPGASQPVLGVGSNARLARQPRIPRV